MLKLQSTKIKNRSNENLCKTVFIEKYCTESKSVLSFLCSFAYRVFMLLTYMYVYIVYKLIRNIEIVDNRSNYVSQFHIYITYLNLNYLQKNSRDVWMCGCMEYFRT